MTGTAQRIRGLAALGALVVLIAGVPWLLWTYGGGAPWAMLADPSGWLTTELTEEAIVGILVVVMWAGWLWFVISVGIELDRARRGRPMTAGGFGSTSVARRLVAAVLLLAGTTTVATPLASASTVDHVSASSVAYERSVDTDATVARAATPPAGLAGESARSAPAALQRVKAETGLSYDVRPPRARHYDSLWDIAERTLGEGRRWKEIYDLNAGRVQADGHRLSEPDLIYPGWNLLLPDDATGPGVIRPDAAGVSEPAPSADGRNRSDSDAPNDAGPGSAIAPDESGTERSEAFAEPVQGTQGAAEGSSAPTLVTLGAGAGLIAAGLLWGLRRRRGWQGGGPPPGRGRAFGAETSLRLTADTPMAAFVDRALRTLGHGPRERPNPYLRLHSARVSGDRLSLQFDGPVGGVPEGWEASADGSTLTVARSVLPNHADGPAAYPHLVVLGADDHDHVLLELAADDGVLHLGGDPERALDLARSVVVDLMTHPWADRSEVLAVGFAEELTALGAGQLRRFDSATAALKHIGRSPVSAAARTIVCATCPTPVELSALGALSAAPRGRVPVVVCGDDPAASRRLVLRVDGTLDVAGVRVRAAAVPSATLPLLAALFGAEPTTEESAGIDAVPGFDPRALDPAAPVAADLGLLGPLDVTAAGTTEPDRRELCSEIAAYLALHPRGAHRLVLAGAVWPRGITDELFDHAMEHVVRWLSDEDGPVVVERDGRWFLDLSRVRVDWHVLCFRSAQSSRSARGLLDALSLVRGRPLTDAPTGRYAWFGADLQRTMNATVVAAAERCADLYADADDLEQASEALRHGLRGVPDAEVLWRRLLRLTPPDNDLLTVAADELYEAIARYGSPLGPQPATVALVDELLPRYRSSRHSVSA